MLIEVSNLVKKFGNISAVNGISFGVEEGTCVGILGPNGAGKTSTVRILQCTSPSSSGDVRMLDMKAGLKSRQIRARIGVVPQENDLDTDLSVWSNLMVFARFFDISKADARSRIDEQLAFMDLANRKTSRIDELSGGMKRRLLIARALINKPSILILDEPTTGLDPQMRHMIWEKLLSLKARGLTMVLTTHYMEEAAKLCDKVIIMNYGKILRAGKPQALIDEVIGPEVVEIRDHGGVFKRQSTLEDVFLKLTGRALNE